jgi:glycerol-3-phosphate acyltransferase PlsY
MRIALIALSIVLSYLLGSLPIGVFAARLIKGVEVRQIGSGRTGATNVYRAAGPWGAVVTSVGDILKGTLAVWIARALTGSAWVEALAGLAAVTGHNWSVFLKFKGGAGTVTSLGVVAGMNPYIPAALVFPAVVVLLISRMASKASITVALAMGPVLAIFAALHITPWAYVLFGVGCGALTIYALLPNIKRILSGEERRLETDY